MLEKTRAQTLPASSGIGFDNGEFATGSLAPAAPIARPVEPARPAAGNTPLTISLREVAARLGWSKPTARLKLKREGIGPRCLGDSPNCKLWYSRREVERFIRRLGVS